MDIYQELDEFTERYGHSQGEFVKRWRQMFGTPPSKTVVSQFQSIHSQLIAGTTPEEDEDDEAPIVGQSFPFE